MKLRSILLSGTCLPLLTVLQAQTPGDATPPDAYVVTVTSSVSGSPLTQRTYRDGSRVIVDRFESAQSTDATASRSRSFYDLDNHTAMTWKFPDSAGGCSQSAISGDWGDPFANSASLTGPNAKAIGQETIHGMTATVYESSMGAKGAMKTWVQDDTGLVFKAELTPPGGAPETILEVSDVSFRPPSTATFALPTNCATATSTAVIRNTDSASASPAAPALPVIYVGASAAQTAAAVATPAAMQPAAAATTTAAATVPAVVTAAQPTTASNASNAATPAAPVNVATAATVPPVSPTSASTPVAAPAPVQAAPAPVQTATVAEPAPPVTAAAQLPAATAAPATPAPAIPSSTVTATAAVATAEATPSAPTSAPQPEPATVASAPASDPTESATDQTVWAAGDPTDFAAATAGPGSHDGCSVVLRIVKAGTMEPIVSGVQVGVGSEAFADSLRQYQQGGASGANLLHGMYAVMPSVRDGMFRIGHAPAQFTLDTSFGAAGDVRSNVGLQCYAPETTLLLVVRNPARIADGTELFWVKSGPQATVSN